MKDLGYKPAAPRGDDAGSFVTKTGKGQKEGLCDKNFNVGGSDLKAVYGNGGEFQQDMYPEPFNTKEYELDRAQKPKKGLHTRVERSGDRSDSPRHQPKDGNSPPSGPSYSFE